MNIALNKIDIPWVRYHYSRDGVKIVGPLWRYQKSMVTSSTERKTNEWDTDTMYETRYCVVIYGFAMSRKK